MDNKRMGITVEQARIVLRRIREKNQEKINPEYPQQFGNGHKQESDALVSHKYSFTTSAYFQPKSFKEDDNRDPRFKQGSEKRFEEKPSSQPILPGTCLIAKRLQSLKNSYTQAPCHYSNPISSAAKRPLVSKSFDTPQCLQSQSTCSGTGISQITTASDHRENNNLKRQFKFEHPTALPTKANKLSTGSNISITSHFAKVKHQRTTPSFNKSEKSTMKRQTKIQEFSSLVTETKNPTKSCIISMESISDEEREFLRKEILSASNVACTLLYEDGRTLLRIYPEKQLAKGVYIAFPKDVTPEPGNVSENYRCVFLPLSTLATNTSLFQWSGKFMTDLMKSCGNKIIYDAQRFIKALLQAIKIEDNTDSLQWRCFDPKIAAWMLDPDHPPEHFDALLQSELAEENVSSPRDENNHSDHKSANKCNDSDDYQVCEDMFSLLSLMPRMFLTLQSKNLWEVFSEVEMKICPILAVMELFGVEIDSRLLLEYGDILQKKARKLEQEGVKIVGHPFQISSTQQLRQILFDELQLDKKVQKKLARTQIKNYKSTSESVLKHLQDLHPLPKIILEYRHVSKLKSTYVDGILCFVKNGTLNTHWNQTCTATGRLTSTNPNIQAIPKNQLDITGVTEQYVIGKEVETFSIIPRQAFKSRTGWSFLSADFQSIELRLLAHFSEDPLLLQIFNRSEDDIFVQLASLWLSIDFKSVENEQRERAKRVVYSVVYGVGKERLAETLGVSPEEAKAFINSFLATFPGLKKFIQNCISHCRTHGHVGTIFGRRRLLPAVNSSDQHLRSQAERQAVNFVIQGSAADICKIGMILVVHSLNEKFKLNTRLLIQIHDELLLEVHDSCLENVKELVKLCLEDTGALCAGRVSLKVNFKVSLSCGKTWAQMQLVE